MEARRPRHRPSQNQAGNVIGGPMAHVGMKNPALARSRRKPSSPGLLVRLQKFLAEAGVASRRAGQQIILAGRVALNREIILRRGTKIHPPEDSLPVYGHPIKTPPK